MPDGHNPPLGSAVIPPLSTLPLRAVSLDQSSHADGDEQRLRLERLIERLPPRLRCAVRWLRKPSSRWARLPAGLLLCLGGLLWILPVLGLWMLPLGLLLLAEDLPPLARLRAHLLAVLDRRYPQLFRAF
jgi:hypothetical protein